MLSYYLHWHIRGVLFEKTIELNKAVNRKEITQNDSDYVNKAIFFSSIFTAIARERAIAVVFTKLLFFILFWVEF